MTHYELPAPREVPAEVSAQPALPAPEDMPFACTTAEPTDIVPTTSSALDARVDTDAAAGEVIEGEIEERFFGPDDMARIEEILSKPPRIPEVVINNDDGTVSVQPDHALIDHYLRILGTDGVPLTAAEVHEMYHESYPRTDTPRAEAYEGYPYAGYSSHTIYPSVPKPPIYAERTDAPVGRETQPADDVVTGEVAGLSPEATYERVLAHVKDAMARYRSGELRMPSLPRIVEVQEDGTVQEVPQKFKTTYDSTDPDMMPSFKKSEEYNDE